MILGIFLSSIGKARRMKTTTVTPNLTQLTRLRFVNAFLVREDDGFTLVDTTTGGAADALIEAAEPAGGAIRRIALTHGHGDHVGSLDALEERARRGRGPDARARRPHPRGGEGRRGQAHRAAGRSSRPSPDVRLERGRPRRAASRSIASPGHSPGHVAFLDTRDRTLIAGDAFTTYGKVAVSNHFLTGASRSRRWRRGTRRRTVESARALRALDPAVLVVGHGPAVRDPGAAMDRAIARARADAARRPRRRDGRRPPRRRWPTPTASTLSRSRGWPATSASSRRRSTRTSAACPTCGGGSPPAARASSAPRYGRPRPGAPRGEALAAVAAAYRDYARAHPGPTRPRSARPTSTKRGGRARPSRSSWPSCGATASRATTRSTRARIVRAALHGFVALETGEGFGIPLDLDETLRSARGGARPRAALGVPVVTALPLPPSELAERVGRLGSLEAYEAAGRALREAVDRALPPDWSWPGKRTLDFGCGAVRVLRHLRARGGVMPSSTGCDIDARERRVAAARTSTAAAARVPQRRAPAAPAARDAQLRPDLRVLGVHAPHRHLERLAARAAPGC